MIKLVDILNKIVEGKQVGTLYHWTKPESLLLILKNNILKANITENYNTLDFRTQNNPDLNIKPHVSFTRMKGKTYGNDKIFALGCALEIDGDKLSNNYKVVPYSMFGHPKIKAGEFMDDDSTYMVEYEERVYKDISNIKNYIKYIILDGKALNFQYPEIDILDILGYIEHLNIPIKYISEYSRYNEPITKEKFLSFFKK